MYMPASLTDTRERELFFYILSAFSIETFETIWHFYCISIAIRRRKQYVPDSNLRWALAKLLDRELDSRRVHRAASMKQTKVNTTSLFGWVTGNTSEEHHGSADFRRDLERRGTLLLQSASFLIQNSSF